MTTALIYANGEIHLGHITSTYLPADIFVRYKRLQGVDTIHVGATDDFGTPILVEAERRTISPEAFVARWNEKDQKDYADLGISFDIFDKTSSKENIELVQHFFTKLYEKGYIYKQSVLQPYCPKDQKFLPDRYVRGTCPYCEAEDQYSDNCEQCGRTFQPSEVLNPRCAICGSTPITKESEHYFFKLTEFAEPLRKWLTENKNLQHEVRNYVLSWIEEGLRNWDISRDIYWGVQIPLDEAKGKVFYVWFDNHICYIATALKYFRERGIDGRKAWNTSTIYHFIGKDIVYHHYLFLPAMRLGVAEYKLPDYIPTRGYFLLEKQKFSKSRGWYISLRDFLDRFPADYLRYYLAAITPYSQQDVNFDWNDFQKRINNELIGNVGNFIHRTLTFIHANYEGKVPKPSAYDNFDEELKNRIGKITEEVGQELDKNELSRGLRRIIEFAAFCNQYFQQKQPWKDKEGAKTCLYLSINAARALAILLHPYLPFSTERLWEQLNLEGKIQKQNWKTASEIAISVQHQTNQPKVLFKKIEDQEIRRVKKQCNTKREQKSLCDVT